ncbi:efflux RND transporter periplasmic adaptor subunit [Spirosoma utsteinense]|uniref:Multidrug efflux pump subunit AcrA (Membrane-fusion protein) n=1 Tax=Spirosoma utsteinense TaxID=2585773 RepID=A0ABR6VZY7_9BACT|nr:efflux RND transporter periplasmic adaptor subunit [Spirosoma utsteinense]MBC3784527.1 multidrug efflux pump subunit AcrA (membrane-fusion protein) [Spirosoma utsteinense]MBC3789722.1 multidrug efflux pump subunit AcrA (membrane-fusion protein) [Spirosoma utsteinense]
MKALLCITSILSGLILTSCNRKQEERSPTYQALTEAVYASGNIFPRNEYTVTADATGVLEQRLVNEGDTIRKNQLLFVLESATQDARQQAAANAYRQSRANLGARSPVLAELEAQVRNAHIRLTNDSVNYNRFRELYAQNATSRAELERAELNYTLSRNNLRAQQNTLLRSRDQIRLDVENNRSQLVTSEVAGNNTRIRSFVDGKVYEVYKDPGEVVRSGEQLALVGSGTQVYAQLAVDESDFGRIRPGQDVVIKTDAYPDKVLKARVRKMYPKLNRSDQSFRVDAEFVGDSPASYYGLTVEANIIISQNRRVLTIPKTYVVGSDSVWIEQAGKKQKVRFRKGAENFDLVEVKSGLSETTKLLLIE